MGRYASTQKIKMGDVDIRIVPALPTSGEAGELVYLSNTAGKGLYVHNGAGWELVGGNNSSGGGGGISTTADRLTTPRRISISGDATGYGIFDGSSDMDIAIDIPLATVNIPGLMTANDKSALTALVDPSGTLKVPLLSNDVALPLDNNASAGISTDAARVDHVHPLPNLATAVSDGLLSKEDKQKLDGLTTGSGSNVNLSNDIPENLNTNAAAGTSITAARSDHVHALPNIATTTKDGLLSKEDKDKIDKMKVFTELLGTIIPKKAIDTLGAVGIADRFSREDHIHPLPDLVTISTNGLMSSSDKLKLDNIPSAPMIPSSEKGAALGVATLLANGKIDPNQLPALSTSNVFVFNNQTDMLATNYVGGTNPVVGDVVVRTDITKSYILKTTPHTSLSNWQELLSPTSPIQSVNGHNTANITLTKVDLQLGNVDNTSDLNKPISTATQTALDGKQDKLNYTPIQSVNGYSSQNITLTKADLQLGNVDNTSDLNKPISIATQTALDDKQDKLNFIPVNKAGDTAEKLLLKAPSVEQNATINISTASTTYTVSYNDGSFVKLNCTLTGSPTFTIAFSGMVTGKVCTIILQCVNFGGKSVVWPTPIKWAGGTAPAFSATGTDIIMILKDATETYYGFLSGKDFK